jgi:hypothetical protein
MGMSSDGKGGKAIMRQTAHDVDEVKRSSTLALTVVCSRDSNVLYRETITTGSMEVALSTGSLNQSQYRPRISS